MSDADQPIGHSNVPIDENEDEGQVVPLDPRVRAIARAIGRQIAREWVRRARPVNDNAADQIN